MLEFNTIPALIKNKGHPITNPVGTPQHQIGVGGHRHVPATLPHQRALVPTVQEVGWEPRPMWTEMEKISCSPRV